MSPIETALVVLVAVQIFLFIILVVGMIILLLAFKKSIDKVNDILGNVENLTDDFGSTLKMLASSIGVMAGRMGAETVRRIFERKPRKS